MDLRGFTNPLSPTGAAALVEPAPHHIGADALRVTFRAGHDLARRYLPAPLEPVEDGLGFAYVADMVKVSADEPEQAYLSPRRTQYGEGIVGFYCRLGERRGRFSAFIWVTEDWSMGFGNLMGWGKKLGDVRRTHVNPFNPAMSAVGPGVKLSGEVSRLGRPVLRIGVEVERALDPAEMPAHGDRGFLLRHQPSPGPDIPASTHLLELRLGGVRTGDVFAGRPHLEIHDAENEDLGPLRDVEPLVGHVYKQGWTTDTDARVVRDYSTGTPG